MMAARFSTAERFGQEIGRKYCAYRRSEQQLAGWFASRGVPLAVVTILLWAIKLGALVLLLYVAFWFAILLVIVVGAANAARQQAQPNDDGTEWKIGFSGYGLYRGETRIDPGHPDDED